MINNTNTSASTASPEQEIDWSQYTVIPKATPMQRLRDIGTSFAGGAIGASKAIADAAGADNAVSAGFGRMQDTVQGWQSPERQAERARRAASITEAENSGSVWREVGANLGGVIEAPISTMAEAAGSVAPVVAAMLATRGRAGPQAVGVGTGLGVAQGLGAVKGSIHDAVKNEHLQAGATPEAASAAAEQAQSYGGPNTGSIALGGALGGVASRLGVEDMVARGIAAKAPAGGVSALRRLGVGAVSEGLPEAIQGGQERYASNVALQHEGFDTPTWQGVAGQATAEGVAGGMLGGATNVFARGPRPAAEQPPVNPGLAPAPEKPLAGGETAADGPYQEGANPQEQETIHPDDNPETGIDPALSPVAHSTLNPDDGPFSRNVLKEMGRGALPVAQPVQAPRPIGERIHELPEQARTQAIILADDINNVETPDGVRQFRRAELDTLLQQHEQSASDGNGPISRGLTANRPSTALAVSELTASDPADWHKTYRRNPVGVPYQNSVDPLDGVQQAVRDGTQYTDQDQVQSVRNELEDAWLALNVSDEPAQQIAPTEQPAQDRGDITPEIDARVRAGRVVSGVRNAFDGGAPNTLRVIQQVNQALRTIGEQSLTQDEIARVRRVADARTAFMGLNLPASLPSDRGQPVPPVDALADNSAMEALIPERQASAQRLVDGGAQIASSQSQTRMDEGVARGAQTEQSVPAGNADITGARVDDDWVTFSPASGSLGVPRAQMPQIDAAHRGALVNYLKGQGVASEQAEVPAHSLKPTQAEFSDAKVRKAVSRAGGDRSVLVSSDGYVVDGHHQWLAKRQAGEAVKVLQLQAPISELLPMVGEFPSVRVAEGAVQVKEDSRSEEASAPAFSESLPELSTSNAPSDFVTAPDGSLEFGQITPEMGRLMRRQAGQIRLQQGVQNADGTGWGLAHIEANHGAQIRALGMDVPAFVAQVASGIEQVWQVPGNRQLLVTLKDGRKDVMYIQLDLAKEGDFYRVNSAFPVRQQDYEARRGMKKVWDGSEPTSAVTGQRPAYATAASAAPESVSSQGSSNARGQGSSVAQPIESQQTVVPLEKPAAARIDDVGEKIGGARKDAWSGFKEELRAVTDDQIQVQPLSKVWPNPDYQKLIEAGVGSETVAMVRALRDAVEIKPRASHKVSRWAGQVAALRSFATDLLDGTLSTAALKVQLQKLSSRSLRDVMGRAELYEAVGHSKSLEGISVGEHQYSMYRGRANVHLWSVEQKSTALGNWPRELATGDTKEQAIEAFKQVHATLGQAKDKKSASFDIITEQYTSDYFVGKKMGRTYAKLAGPFKTTREARQHRDNHEAELVKALEVFKLIPKERGDENRPRVGQDLRQGLDVTPTQFRETFGFRGVEFGNWVEQGKRQDELNQAYDALMDMAAVLQLPAKALSLNGELGLAFGARGAGGVGAAKAHYEPNKVVINMTKRQGAGSLGHEWWHATDNYFSRMRSQALGYMTDSQDVAAVAAGSKIVARAAGVRPEMIDAFGAVMRAINATALRARSAKLDERRTKDYWSTDIELSARAFESYLIGKLQDQNASNDYLANVVSPKAWDAAASVGLREDGAYPYPTADEIQPIRASFDKLFQTVETRESDHGLALFSSRSTAPEAKLSLERVQQIVNTALAGIPGAPPVHVVRSPADIGLVTSGEDVHSGVTLRSGDIYVFQSGVGSELDVLKTIFHELFHRGMRNVLPADQYVQTMLDLAKRDSRVQSYANAWKRLPIAAEQRVELSNMGFSGSELQARFEALAIEEGLAVVAEELKAEKQAGNRSVRLRALANWLAGIADKLGLDSVGNALRRMSYNEAERFVLSAIDASGQAMTASVRQASQSGAGVDTMRTALPEGLAKAVGDSIRGMTVQNVRKQAGFKLTDYMGLGLQFLGRRQLVEVYGTALPQLSKYSDLMARMDADKNEAGAGADQLATEWGQLADENQLAEVMHDATVAQIDPTKDYVEGDNKTDWKALKARYEALSPQARDIFIRARDSYSSHMREVRQAIKERIERSGMTEQRKADMIKQMDGDFFGHVKGVYFPLARFGQYVVVVKDNLGKAVNVSRAETMAEADQLRTTLAGAYPKGQGFTVGKVLKAKDFVADRDTVGSGFIKELYGVLDKQGMDAAQRAELEDSIGQLYLASMPDLSWAKHGIHRKGTAGFSQNARRAFAQNTFHGARYLAKLRYSDLLQDELTAMDEHIAMRDSSPTYPSVRARQVLDEMVKRHDAAMNPNGHPLSTALTSFGFMFHLGLSPASALVNMTQTALVAYPVMGAKWGFAKAGDALLRASKETVQGKNDIAAYLNKDEKAAYDEAVRSGVIDVTMAHDLAGIAQGEDSGVMWKIRPMMKWASFLFHHAEKFNRQATFVAAYRLARDAGTAHLKAYEEAVKATYDGHFDYSSNNRPRIMQGNAARVLLLFKQYAQNMVYAFARSALQSMRGQSAKERAEARKVLGGLLVMHGMAAGALGLPMVSTLLAVASMLGGDDDEPFDAQTALQNMLADAFGQKPAEVMAHGLSRLTPWDISGRVGLDNLIFPDLQEGLEGQRLAESAMAAALGPVAGIGTNVLRGVQNMAEGHYLRGLESMMPSFLRNPIKAIRYGNEGVKDKSGIVVKDEVDYAGLIGQFAGFSPSEVRLAYEGKAAISQHDRALGARRSTLMEQYAMAAMAGDEEGKTEAREAITRFNEKNPSRMIKPLQLGQSIRMRQRRIDQAQDGVYLPRNRRDAVEAGRFANQD